SSKTINGALPPSSIEVRSTFSQASASSRRPTGVEPVKETLRRQRSFINGPEIAEVEQPETTLSTLGGSPASIMAWAKYRELSGVSCAGFRTMVAPAATAGATLRVAIANGKFHGVISNEGPTGLWRTIMVSLPSGVSAKRP